MDYETVMDGLAELPEAGGQRAAALEAMRYQMLREEGAGTELVRLVGATAEGADVDEAALALFAGTLEAARTAAENDHLGGQRFLDEARAEVEAICRAETLAPVARLELARAFVRAGLAPPPSLALPDEDTDLPEGSYPPAPPAIEALLDRLTELGEDPAAAHAELRETMGAMPPGVRDAVVAALARRDDPTSARIASYFLLDGEVRVRRAAAEGVLGRIGAGSLDAASAGRLALLRPWLPADAAREAVDRALKAATAQGAFGGAAPTKWKLGDTRGSIPDGVGAMSFAVPLQAGRRRAIAMLLLKQGFGVKDAYVLPCASAAQQRQLLDQIALEMDAVKVGIGHVAAILEMALAEGLDAGLPPAPGLLDVVESAGITDLKPQPRTTAEIVADFGVAGWTKDRVERAAARSASWVDDSIMVENWFEDNAEVRALLEAHAGDDAAAEAIRGYLETRRGWWARIFALSALTLKASGTPDSGSFAAVAHLVESGAPLEKLPIFDSIVEETVAAREQAEWDEPEDEGEAFGEGDEGDADEAPWPLRSAPKPEEPGELARILAGSELTPAWLDGYLMAVLVAPKMVRPGDWMGELMQAGPVLPDIVAVQRYLDLVTARSNAAVVDTDDPERLKARVAAVATEDLADWARGFSRMVRRFGSAWRDKSVKKEDKAVLSLIEAVGRGEKPGELGPVLAEWLGHRRAAIR